MKKIIITAVLIIGALVAIKALDTSQSVLWLATGENTDSIAFLSTDTYDDVLMSEDADQIGFDSQGTTTSEQTPTKSSESQTSFDFESTLNAVENTSVFDENTLFPDYTSLLDNVGIFDSLTYEYGI